MKTTLISITPKAEETIMYCARVSNPLNQDSKNSKLIDYCIKHHHWSIFEMANMVIEIQTSRAISAQILRHRSFSFQEFSQRYAEVQSTEKYRARRQDEKNRQNSVDDFDDLTLRRFNIMQDELDVVTKTMYEDALKMGIAKEQARFLLPMSSSSTLYMNGTIRSWIHYINLRAEEGTQKEHRDIADSIKQIFCEQLPQIGKALNWL